MREDSCLRLFLLIPRPPSYTLFPYTTLFRSGEPGRCHSFPKRAIAPVRGIDVLAVRETLHEDRELPEQDRKSTRLNSSHTVISYAVFCLKKKSNQDMQP